MGTGCSAALIRVGKVKKLDLEVAIDIVPIYGTRDVTIPAIHTIGKALLRSLQVDDACAYNVEAMVVPDNAIPEEMCVGREFLVLPHRALLRFDDEFFVGSRETTLQKIRRARPENPLAAVEVTIRPGTAALVRAETGPSSAVVVRARDRDLVFHSDVERIVFTIIRREQRGS